MHAEPLCKNASMFDWDDARYVLAIARDRSLTAAARRLGVQQSTAGRRLAVLEATLGTRLFDRGPRGLIPTPAGTTLLAHAERMENEALAVERTLSDREDQVAGIVRVTAPQAFGNLFVMPLLARLCIARPELVVELIAENTNLNLSQREADLAVRIGRPSQPGLVVRRLGALVNGLYAAPGYLARRKRPRAGLAGHDIVDLDDTYLQKGVIHWFRGQARDARVAARANATPGIAAAVQARLGIGPLPCWLGDALPGVRRVLPACSLTQDLWLVMHRDSRHTARVRTVIDFLGDEIAQAAPVLLGAGHTRTRPARRSSRRGPAASR
jgi:DNA-binding transcriptional LysR family regulator